MYDFLKINDEYYLYMKYHGNSFVKIITLVAPIFKDNNKLYDLLYSYNIGVYVSNNKYNYRFMQKISTYENNKIIYSKLTLDEIDNGIYIKFQNKKDFVKFKIQFNESDLLNYKI